MSLIYKNTHLNNVFVNDKNNHAKNNVFQKRNTIEIS